MQDVNAFDDEADEASAPPPALGCYITPVGLARFRDELAALRHQERPRIVEIVSWAAGNGDRSENGDYLYGKRRLREIDRRLRFLDRRIRHAIVVEPHSQPSRDRVYFGAIVTYEADDAAPRRVRIVGVDEADTARGEVSLASPVARALIGARTGEEVRIHRPGGVELAEILSIEYPDAG
jgi:transcription elongation factor GreB